MLDTVINDDLISFEDRKIPVITIVDRHDEDISLLEVFLLQKSLDLVLILGKYIGCKVGIE